MTRVKGGPVAKNRRRKVLKRAKGYFGSKHRLYKTAQEQLFHSGAYAYRDRRQKRREFRKLWITRINAACRENNISYSKFIDGLSKANVTINRKMLSEIAIDNPKYFSELVKIANAGLEGKTIKQEEVKTEAKETKKEVKEEKTDLSNLTVAQLREIAKDKNIEGYSTMKKAELISALE
ncbi:MAG: 50S ribosomal protein L20 [Mollicutes bacterium]|jgi:large subunit ribosomal protein L20|nr:50S ribosomal protein L20 [Mollicutes bacterium]